MKALIDAAVADALAGKALSRDGIVELLAMDPESPECDYLCAAADDLARKAAGGRGYIWGAIGLDFAPCEMNCDFCSFAAKYPITKNAHVFTDDEVLEKARRYAKAGVDYLTLRSTEFYDMESIARLARLVRKEAPGNYVIFVNIGELDVDQATFLHDNGVFGAYHACRLREGIDTPFDPEVRLNTMRSIAESPLKLGSCVEPIGPEHTNEEIADSIRTLATIGVYKTGVMSRSPVKGTRFEDIPLLRGPRLMQILATLRVAMPSKIHVTSCYPLEASNFTCGANQTVFETGAVPRDSKISENNWHELRFEDAKNYLRNAGFSLRCDNRA